jgi:hypothetical protein
MNRGEFLFQFLIKNPSSLFPEAEKNDWVLPLETDSFIAR